MSPRATLRRPLAVAGVVLIVVVLVAGSCTIDSGRRSSGTVPTTVAPLVEFSADQGSVETVPLPPGFVPADTRGVPLLGFPDYGVGDKPAIPVIGGEATLHGRVIGPEGSALVGATVRLERFVDGAGGFIDVPTNDDGEYNAVGLLGGHYRLRAWIEPSLATVSPQSTFLADDASIEVDIAMELHEGRKLSAAITVPEPEVGVATFFQALLVEKEVDEDGIVRGKPIPNAAVSVLPVGGVRVDSDNPAMTDEEGLATFVVMCLSPAVHTLAVFSAPEQFAYEMPECKPGTGEIPPPPTTNPDPEAPTTTMPDAQFDVGASFTPPFSGPVPAGTYVATSGGAACKTTYEVYNRGRWILTQTNGGALRIGAVTRNFRTVGFTPACTFVRVR